MIAETKPATLALRVENVPADLAGIHAWVLWSWERREGKWTKPPRMVDGRPASSTDPTTCAPFEDVCAVYDSGACDGVGFVLDPTLGFVGFDLDHVIDERGTIHPEALRIVAEADSYTERSPSGTGLRIIARGTLPAGWRNARTALAFPIECYTEGRYLTITGHHLEGTPRTIEERTAAVAALHARVAATIDAGNGHHQSQTTPPTESTIPDDAKLLERARTARNGAKFAALWAGQVNGGSPSEADLALCNLLAFWTGKDAARMDRLFRQSGLMREKWDERRGAKTYGERTIDVALKSCSETYSARIIRAEAGHSNGHAQDGPVLVRLADVAAEAVEYLWAPRIPLGKLSLVVGDPGGGKTYLTSADLAARVSRGGTWSDGGRAFEGAVIILTSEDGMADTLRPRLDRQGGDPSRVHVLHGVRVDGAELAFNLERDLAMLEQAFVTTTAKLGIIDPLSAYLGSKDSYKDSEIRGILSPLAQLAERLRVAIIGILHLTKDQQRRLVMRVQGNIAFVAQARSVLAVGADPETPTRRLLVHLKNNLGPEAPTLAFRITDDGLTWEAVPVEGVADHLLATDPVATRAERSELEEAAEFLRGILASHPVPSKQVEADAKANGIAQRTLWRAKKALKVKAEQMPTGAGSYAWHWYLPAGGAA